MKKKIEKLKYREPYRTARIVSFESPSTYEIVNKMNQIIERLNDLNHQPKNQ